MLMCWIVSIVVNDHTDYPQYSCAAGNIIHPTNVSMSPHTAVITRELTWSIIMKWWTLDLLFASRSVQFYYWHYTENISFKCHWQWNADGCCSISLKTILWQGACIMGQWFCDAASIYNRWALQQYWNSPGIPTKNNTELSASILHPGTVFIWITPPNPLSNDMTQWVTIPQILLREKHSFWQRGTRMQWKRGGFKWVLEEQSTGMITAHQICISTESMCDSERITLTHLTAKASLASGHFSAGGFGKVNRIHPKTFENRRWSTTLWLKCFMLTGPWTHPVEIYLELTRESVTVQHDSLGTHEQADVSEGGPNENTKFRQCTLEKCILYSLCSVY